MKVGDKVEIIGDDMFVRVGYPFGYNEAKLKFEIDHDKSADQVLVETFPYLKYYNTDKLCRELIFAYNDQHLKYGGSQRTIHTTKRPDLNGRFAIISEVKRVVTGDRQPGCSDHGPYLENQKVHMIYSLNLMSDTQVKYTHNLFGWSQNLGPILEIGENIKFEKKNLKLIERSPA